MTSAFQEKKEQKVKIGLLGFGKAGKAAATVILQDNNFNLEWVLRKQGAAEHKSVAEILNVACNDPGILYSSSSIAINELLDKHPVDFIIDFSTSSFIYKYGEIAADRRVKIVSAISHYNKEEIDLLKELAKTTTVFWSPNITLGVNYLMFMAKNLKKLAPWIDIEIVEEHNKHKTEVSGTALKMANALDIGRSDVSSVRVDEMVSKHEVVFGLPHQKIRLVHESTSKEAFGAGALLMVQHLISKQKGFYSAEDILLPIFNETIENNSNPLLPQTDNWVKRNIRELT